MRYFVRFFMMAIFIAGGMGWAAEDSAPRMAPWSLDTIQDNLLLHPNFHPFPRYQDREFWERIKNDPLYKSSLEEVIQKARELATQDMPWLRASTYLDFQRTGQRRPYENLLGKQSEFLSAFALAECLEGKGEFLDPLMDAIWRYCEMSDWCMPAHTKGLADMKNPHIDLGATHIVATLGELVNVFGEALPEAVRNRIDDEANRRIFKPYLSRDFSWVNTQNNWNAVCNGNIIRAALYLVHESEPLVQIIQKAQNGMTKYLMGFDRDGGTAEGIGYWNYGFSRYVYAAFLLNRYTDKKLNLLEPTIVKEIAQFPVRIEMSVGNYPSFSDGGESNACPVGLLCYLSDELSLPELRAFAAARMPETIGIGSLSGLFYESLVAELPQRDVTRCGWKEYNYLSGVEWMISRVDAKDPNTLVVAAKGGRNDEPHNHNDVGNCIVHLNGESLIVDMGAPVYERDFFQSDKRYSYFTARSLGHSVPFVNGFEQRPGPFGAKNVQSTHTAERDSLISDIADAYPQEAGLQSLIRHVSLFRESGGRVEIGDHAIFRESPRSYESALLTFGNVETPQPGQLRIQGEKASLSIEYDASLWEIAVEEKSSKEVLLRVAEKYPVIRRIAFRCIKPAMEIDWKIVVLPGK